MNPVPSPSLSQRAADQLRDGILRGDLLPGEPLREVLWAERLNVSRNTLREALRDLVAEGLIETRAHHGATVRALGEKEIREIFAIRAALEPRGLTCSAYAPREAMADLAARIDALRQAAELGDWRRCGTLSLAFHQAIVAFIGSARLDRLFASVCAQARLAFALAPDARRFQEPWIARDAEICERLCRGDRAGAAHALELYLQESERTVLEAARARALFPPVIPRATSRERIEDEPQ